ncbi:hypothetical protein [Streptomyces sp. WM6378]|uniref:hypothetical protein n=1 Tax=Streptomyces sp. WM6378 TaxID=1415557 RepID=UPI00131BBCCE|nr:hypothetical protein [Streptomyces sp. WM6378]
MARTGTCCAPPPGEAFGSSRSQRARARREALEQAAQEMAPAAEREDAGRPQEDTAAG